MSMSNPTTPPEDTYFNDLSRNPSHRSVRSVRSVSPQDGPGRGEAGEAGASTRLKRIACIICRRRKLKCDGEKPRCGTCSRLGHQCAYDEIRRKSGPKRGYVKELEARLGDHNPHQVDIYDLLLMPLDSSSGDTTKVEEFRVAATIAEPVNTAAYFSAGWREPGQYERKSRKHGRLHERTT